MFLYLRAMLLLLHCEARKEKSLYILWKEKLWERGKIFGIIIYSLSLSNSTFIIKDTVFGQTVDTTQKDPTYGR